MRLEPGSVLKLSDGAKACQRMLLYAKASADLHTLAGCHLLSFGPAWDCCGVRRVQLLARAVAGEALASETGACGPARS